MLLLTHKVQLLLANFGSMYSSVTYWIIFIYLFQFKSQFIHAVCVERFIKKLYVHSISLVTLYELLYEVHRVQSHY